MRTYARVRARMYTHTYANTYIQSHGYNNIQSSPLSCFTHSFKTPTQKAAKRLPNLRHYCVFNLALIYSDYLIGIPY